MKAPRQFPAHSPRWSVSILLPAFLKYRIPAPAHTKKVNYRVEYPSRPGNIHIFPTPEYSFFFCTSKNLNQLDNQHNKEQNNNCSSQHENLRDIGKIHMVIISIIMLNSWCTLHPDRGSSGGKLIFFSFVTYSLILSDIIIFSVRSRLRRQHFTVAQRICTTAQCFHIYFGNAGEK